MIEVDAMKFTGCGLCSDECPAGIFLLSLDPRGSRTAQVRHVDECTFAATAWLFAPKGPLSTAICLRTRSRSSKRSSSLPRP